MQFLEFKHLLASPVFENVYTSKNNFDLILKKYYKL